MAAVIFHGDIVDDESGMKMVGVAIFPDALDSIGLTSEGNKFKLCTRNGKQYTLSGDKNHTISSILQLLEIARDSKASRRIEF